MFNFKTPKNGEKIAIDNIKESKERLVQLGYVPCEVDHMIIELSNGKNISTLDLKTIKMIEEVLKNKINFASACLNTIKSN